MVEDFREGGAAEAVPANGGQGAEFQVAGRDGEEDVAGRRLELARHAEPAERVQVGAARAQPRQHLVAGAGDGGPGPGAGPAGLGCDHQVGPGAQETVIPEQVAPVLGVLTRAAGPGGRCELGLV